MILTKELYDFIDEECNSFEKETGHFVEAGEVLYSYLNSEGDNFHILNDWDEGKDNDPYWNNELDEHSVIVFLKKTCKKIKIFKQK